MRRTIWLAFVLFPLTSVVIGQTTAASKYIGYKYAGVVPNTVLPNGVRHLGGGLIGNIDADPVYGISQLQKAKTKMLWLEVSTGRDVKGISGWKVLDVLSFGPRSKSDYIFFVGDPAINCTLRGNQIPNLVGIGRIIRRQATFKPSNLWVANLRTKKFEVLSTAGVKCEYSEP